MNTDKVVALAKQAGAARRYWGDGKEGFAFESDAQLMEFVELVGMLDQQRAAMQMARETLEDICDTLGECGMTEKARTTVTAIDEALAAPQEPVDELDTGTIRQRDRYHEMADELAEAIAQYFGVEIGEHSNVNCPWTNALEWISNSPKKPQGGKDAD